MKAVQILICLLLVGISTAVQSQNFLSWRYADRYFSVAAGLGKVAYFGELNEPKRIQTALANYTIDFEARLLTRIGARVGMGYYKINGADYLASPDSSFNQQRNLSFESGNFEGFFQGVYYLKAYRGDYFRRWKADPFIAIGIGITTLNPKTTLNNKQYVLRDFQTEGIDYGKTSLMIPAATGVKLKVNEFINFTVELAFRYTFTDYLDDVSTVYVDKGGDNLASSLANRKDEVGVINQEAYDQMVPGGRRGDASNNDHYGFLNFKLEVFLPNNDGPLLKKPSAY